MCIPQVSMVHRSSITGLQAGLERLVEDMIVDSVASGPIRRRRTAERGGGLCMLAAVESFGKHQDAVWSPVCRV